MIQLSEKTVRIEGEESQLSTVELKRRLSRIMRRLGYGDCAANVYSALIFMGSPSSIDALSRSVRYCQTAVSMALSELEETGLVNKEKDGRRYMYTADEHFILKFEITVEELLNKELRPFRRALEEFGEGSLKEGARGVAQRLLSNAQDAERKLRSYIRMIRHPDTTEMSE